MPANIYLRGKIAGDPRSRAVISVLENGEVRGLATSVGRLWLIGALPGETQLRSREVDQLEKIQEGGDFRCELDDLGPAAFRASSDADADALASLLAPGPLAAAAPFPRPTAASTTPR